MQVPEMKAGQTMMLAVQNAQNAAPKTEGKRARASEAPKTETTTVPTEVLKTDEDDAATGVAGFPDWLSSCCPPRETEEDDENNYCGSCGSLGAFFAPLQPCWDSLVQCLLGLWNSLCGRLQGGSADPVQGFVTKWSAPNMGVTKKMQPTEKQRITQEFAAEFMALPEEVQIQAFTKRFTAFHLVATKGKDYKKEEDRRALVTQFPVDKRLLNGIQTALNKQQKALAKAQAEQQKAEKAGK